MGAAPIALLPHENGEAAGADGLIGEIDGLGPLAVAGAEADVNGAAHKMLMSRTRPVKEIAAACGFPTLENFYRRYRQRFGHTPRG